MVPTPGFGYNSGVSTVPVGDARDSFSRLLAQVERTHERVTITRHGRPVAVMLSAEDLAALEETAEILSHPDTVAAIEEGLAELDAGAGTDGDEITARFRRG
jgi:prevent-host-death family protein